MATKTPTFTIVEMLLDADVHMNGVSPRDSDNELILQFLQSRGANLDDKTKNLMRSVSFESITRARRKLQEKGRFMPSPEVAKRRRLKGYEVEQTAPKETAEGIQRRIEEN